MILKIIEKILRGRYSCFCFDIFDTLIERPYANPTDVFRDAGRRVLGRKEAERFRVRRIRAEQEARLRKAGAEVELKDIYKYLKGYDYPTARRLMHAEMGCEMRARPRKGMVRLMNRLHESHHRILLVSDMYLPEPFLKKLLDKCGVEEYDQLWLSNTWNCGKADGELFRQALAANGMPPERTLHIGDSLRADFMGAHKAGLRALLIPRHDFLPRCLISLKVRLEIFADRCRRGAWA